MRTWVLLWWCFAYRCQCYAAASMSETNFSCMANTTCGSLIGYMPTALTNFGAIQSLFVISDLRDIPGVNGLPDSTRPDDLVEANATIRVLIDCDCTGYSGRSNKGPNYQIQPNDTLSFVATQKFNGLVRYQDIDNYNPQANPVDLRIGEEVYIPLPCSCSMVNGSQTRNLLHYVFMLDSVTNLEQIAGEYGTTPAAILSANGLEDPKQITSTG